MFSAISPLGTFVEGKGVPEQFVGIDILKDGDFKVLEQLKSIEEISTKKVLWQMEKIERAHPTCSRCHEDLLFRSTPQWFIDIKGNLIQLD